LKYCVSVRALCNFTAKYGDLDLRFTPAPSAQEGIAGHAIVASRRNSDYQREIVLEGQYKTLIVRGRADGYDPIKNQLEEVKTYRGDLHNIADNKRALHWAQVKIYGWLLCQTQDLKEINLALVYFDIGSTEETPLVELFTAAALKNYFEEQSELFIAWAQREQAHQISRNAALSSIGFPHTTFRPGQRDLAEAVYKTASKGQCLMAQATTGIGKTIATVFPLLKAMPKHRLDKLFFLAAKTPGRKLALDTLALMGKGTPNLPLRILELVSRDKSCEHPDKACHGDSCPLARGFYDRLPQARYAAVQSASTGALDKSATRNVALAHHICPYYLSQEMAIWADVVVGDYNYYFDTSALLHALTVNHQWRVSVLVDESHNMIERARSMYSAALDQRHLQAVHAASPKAVRGVLDKLNRAFNDMHKTQVDDYHVVEEIPLDFLKNLQQAITVVTEFLVANPTRQDAELQAFYFEALHFARMAESFGSHSMFDITLHDAVHENALLVPSNGCATLNIRNIVPAPFLSSRFTTAHSVALFSATLSPPEFYKETLGLPQTTAWIDVASPFCHTQLYVAAVRNVSTRYNDRDQSLILIAELMAEQYEKTPGNYLAFTSSYDYLQKLAQCFTQRYPHITTWTQTRQMDEAGRTHFLHRFTNKSKGVGFAVLGGAFAEGIDLPGARLIGAFIATLGMPQINAVNEEIKNRMAAYFETSRNTSGKAHNYTYLYPGLQKVVQAAGRVIRTQEDTGVIYLMDDRFTRPEVQRLLPAWWRINEVTKHRPEKEK